MDLTKYDTDTPKVGNFWKFLSNQERLEMINMIIKNLEGSSFCGTVITHALGSTKKRLIKTSPI